MKEQLYFTYSVLDKRIQSGLSRLRQEIGNAGVVELIKGFKCRRCNKPAVVQIGIFGVDGDLLGGSNECLNCGTKVPCSC